MQPVAAPVNARGDVAFFATLTRSSAEEALFVVHNGRTLRIAAVGDAAPGGGTLGGFTEHPALALARSGAVAFSAAIAGGRAADALFIWAGGKLRAIAQSGAKAPEIAGGAFINFAAPAINDADHVAFLAGVRRGRETTDAIYLSVSGRLTKLVATGDPVPGGGLVSALAAPALNNRGAVAFAALVEQGQRPAGIFIVSHGEMRRVVGAGDTMPDGGMFTRLSERIGLDDSGHVAFGAFLRDGTTRAGIFIADTNSVRRIAGLGTAAPGGGTFASFGDAPAMAADGRVAFIASVDGGTGAVGAFSYGPEGPTRIATVGDKVPDGGRIAYFPINPVVAAGPGGRITFHAGLQAGSEATDAIVEWVPAIR
jgi:hypothetical protein